MTEYRRVGNNYVLIKDGEVFMEETYVIDTEHLNAKEQSPEL